MLTFQHLNKFKPFIKQNKWLLTLPISLLTINWLIGLAHMFYVFNKQNMLGFFFGTDGLSYGQPQISLLKIFSIVISSFPRLNYAYNSAIFHNRLFLLIIIAALILFPAFIKKITPHTEEDNQENLKFMGNILLYSFTSSIVSMTLIAISFFTKIISLFIIFSLIQTIILTVVSIQLFSLFIGFVLFLFKTHLLKEENSYKDIFNKMLRVIKPLFISLLIIGIISSIPTFLKTPHTLAALLKAPYETLASLKNLSAFSNKLWWVNPVLITLTICLPFQFTLTKYPVKEALSQNYLFIKNNIANYSILICAGIILLSLPSLFFLSLESLIKLSFFWKSVTGYLSSILWIIISAIYFFVLYDFFLGTASQEQ